MAAIATKYKDNPFLIGVACALIATLGLSFKAILIKFIYQVDANVDAISILAIRMALAMPLFYILLRINSRKGDTASFSKRDIGDLLLLGFIGFYLSAILDFSALAYISASLERLILFLYPTFVVLFTLLIKPKQITGKIILAMISSYAGIVIVFYDQAPAMDSVYIKGALLVFSAAVAFAFYTVSSVKHIERHGALRFTFYAMAGASLATLIHALYSHGISTFVQPIAVYMLIIPMAIFSTVLPLILMAEGVRRIGAPTASIISTSGPMVTITLAYFVLDETFGLMQAVGGLMIVLGVFFVAKK